MLDFIQMIWNWNNGLLRYILFAVFVLAAGWFGASLNSRRLVPTLNKRLDNEKFTAIHIIANGFKKPISLFLVSSGVALALLAIAQWRPEVPVGAWTRLMMGLPNIIYRAWRMVLIVCVTWGLLASSDLSSLILRDARHRLDLKMSKSVAHFLSAMFRVIVIAFATLIILSEFNINVNGIVTGLGLGGLTIALAAKDSAENFFGGLILVMEKPFEIGDWIACDGVEGTVEDISIRSTKVRTGPGALTIVPNAKLSGAAITNWSGGMEKRRASFFLNINYGTNRDDLKAYVSAVRSMIQKDPDVITDSVIVRFSELTESSLNVQIIFYTSIPAMGEHLRIRERINFNLLSLAEKNNIQFAFPSRSVYLHTMPEQQDTPPVQDT